MTSITFTFGSTEVNIPFSSSRRVRSISGGLGTTAPRWGRVTGNSGLGPDQQTAKGSMVVRATKSSSTVGADDCNAGAGREGLGWPAARPGGFRPGGGGAAAAPDVCREDKQSGSEQPQRGGLGGCCTQCKGYEAGVGRPVDRGHMVVSREVAVIVDPGESGVGRTRHLEPRPASITRRRSRRTGSE